jgi:hypothetical protein
VNHTTDQLLLAFVGYLGRSCCTSTCQHHTYSSSSSSCASTRLTCGKQLTEQICGGLSNAGMPELGLVDVRHADCCVAFTLAVSAGVHPGADSASRQLTQLPVCWLSRLCVPVPTQLLVCSYWHAD